MSLRPTGRFWTSGEEARTMTDLIQRFPRLPEEGALHYCERIAILAGRIRDGDRSLLRADEDPKTGELMVIDARLPYREPGVDE